MSKVKSKVSILLVIFLLTLIFPLFGSRQSQSLSSGDYEYVLENGTATITEYTGHGGNITIPSTLNGYSVTRIGDHAFFMGFGSAYDIAGYHVTNVTIPDSVTFIGNGAFGQCAYLESIVIPDSVTHIGGYAFQHCERLSSVVIGDGVTSIEAGAFRGCTYLKEIYIGASVRQIDATAFADCEYIESIEYAYGITQIDDYGSVYDLKHLVLPDSVVSIGDYAFFGHSLDSLTIPDSVENIGKYAFDSESLRSLFLGQNVRTIGDGAFERCPLTDLDIPNSVSTIGYEAFAQCKSLTTVTIGSGITGIYDGAFEDCSWLDEVVFLGAPPSGVGKDIFKNCAPGFTIYYYGDYGSQWSPNGETTWHGYPIVSLSATGGNAHESSHGNQPTDNVYAKSSSGVLKSSVVPVILLLVVVVVLATFLFIVCARNKQKK